jgi:hypothetical protein
VIELCADASAGAMDRISQALETRNESVLRYPDLPFLQPAERVRHADRAHDQHRRATRGARGIEGDALVADGAVLVGEVRTHRGLVQPVLQLQRADPTR